MVWPIPSADVHLEYSYRVQHSDLSTATGAWSGVPDNILRAIEWKAFQLALLSGIQPDPEGARAALGEVERRMIEFFAAPIDFEKDLWERFREQFGAYLGEAFPRRVRAFPYLEFYRDKGFRVIGCGAGGSNFTLWHGMPDFPRYMDNIATWSQRAAEAGVLGVVTSAWYDFPVEALMPGIMCTGQTAWNPGAA